MADNDDLVISAGFSDAKLVAEANRVVAMFKKKGEEAQKAFVDAQGKVTNTQAVRAHMRDMDRLAKTYDPAYRAAKVYEKQVEELSRALKTGAIDQKQYVVATERAARQMKQAAEATDQAGRQMGGQWSNLGFQVGDFATQVGAGTSAVQAMGQQLPQLLGGFGTFGALAGAAAAILIPLGAAILKAGDASSGFDDKLKSVTEATDLMTAAIEAAETPLSVLTARYGEAAGAAQSFFQQQSQVAQAVAQAELAKLGQALGGQGGQMGDASEAAGPLARLLGSISGVEVDRKITGTQSKVKELMDTYRLGYPDAERLAVALQKVNDAGGDTTKSLAAGEALTRLLIDIAGGAEKVADRFSGEGGLWNRAKAYFDAASGQAAAMRSEFEKLADRYQTDTEKFKDLSQDRETAQRALDEAIKSGSDEAVKLAEERIRLIDKEISKTQQLARETDLAFQGMLRAYTEYADSRRAGNEWANSSAGFEAQYVAQRAAGSGSQEEELVRSVTALSEQMGIAAKDLLAVMSFETSGKLRPDTMGPVTEKWGQHFGLIQWGERGAAKRYGVSPDDTITQQVIAAGKYLQDAGVKAGDNLATIYAAVLSGDARKVHASDLAAGGVVGDVTQATSGDQFAPHIARAEGLLAAYGGIAQQSREDVAEADKALKDQIRERERLAKQAKEYGEQLSRNLLTDQETARLNAQQADQIAAIKAQGLGDEAESRAIAGVTAEIEKQRTILTLLADAKRRNVDLDAMLADGSMTYRDAINALGEAKRAEIVATNERAVAEGRVAEAQELMAQAQERTKQGLIDSIVAGESFTQVLAGVAQMFAKVALEAALFNTGPWASGGQGGGMLGGVWNGLRGLLGFASGGYTGNIGTSTPAGIVHGGEYVMSAPAVQRIGLPALEAMHNGGGQGGAPKITIINEIPDARYQVEYATKDEVRMIATQAVAGASRMQQDRQYLRNGR